jgi:D-3-phosphoglycerate dehydrogenase
MSVMSPYIGIAETLGGICTQLAGSFDAIEIGYAGEIFDDVRMITLAALKGVLAPSMGPTVNYVNAPEIAKGRKIKIKESKSAEAEETPSITISLAGSGGTRSNISGMQVSEAGADDTSIMILNVDSEVSDNLLGEIRAVDGVFDAELIRL